MITTFSEADRVASAITEAAMSDGWKTPVVSGLKQLSGGASNQSWAFDLASGEKPPAQMVLRRQSPEARFTHKGIEDLACEADLIRQVFKAGVPVPEVFFSLPGPAVNGYTMARISGESIGVRILKSAELSAARKGLARRCGEVLALIHSVPTDTLKGLKTVGAKQALSDLEDRFMATGQARPVFEYALRWLRHNLPEENARVLVHGDFRNGNLIVGPDGLRAVLDWEQAYIGPPAADLAWLCVTSWRFQNPEKPVGGFGTREDLIAGYAAAGGTPPSAEECFAWEVFQTLNWGVMCAEVGYNFEEGVRSVEGAMIARRASETEFDLLRLLLPDDEAWYAG